MHPSPDGSFRLMIASHTSMTIRLFPFCTVFRQQNSPWTCQPKATPEEMQRTSGKLREVAVLAERLGCTTSQLAIAWSLKNEHVHSVLIGAISVQQLYEHLQALQVSGWPHFVPAHPAGRWLPTGGVSGRPRRPKSTFSNRFPRPHISGCCYRSFPWRTRPKQKPSGQRRHRQKPAD